MFVLKNKKKSAILLAALLLLLAAGCGPADKKTTVQESSGYSITDVTGSKIFFKEPPKRIISLSSSVDEILLDLVAPERIAALSILADDPGICAAAAKAGTVSARVKGNSIESILMLNPDLVLMPDWRGRESAESLRAVGVAVYVYSTPVTLPEIEASIRNIAQIVNEKEKGEELALGMRNKLRRVKESLGEIPAAQRQTVVAMSLMGAFGGSGTTFDDLCKYAQVKNGLSLAGVEKNAIISKEMIVAIDPEIFILPSWDFGEANNAKNYVEQIRNDPAFSSVRAIKSNRLVQVHDAYLYSTSHYAVQAVGELARAAYPDKFAE